MKRMHLMAGGLAVLAVLLLALGCGQTPDKKGGDKAAKDKNGKDEEHPHGPGPHGGTIFDDDGNKYHLEFKPDHGKQEASLWILGSDEKTAVPVKADDGHITISITGLKTKETFEVVFKADRQEGDPEGKVSRFTGKHEKLGIEQELKGTISGRVDGKPLTADFEEKAEDPKKGKK